jgi:hypothetical protein
MGGYASCQLDNRLNFEAWMVGKGARNMPAGEDRPIQNQKPGKAGRVLVEENSPDSHGCG